MRFCLDLLTYRGAYMQKGALCIKKKCVIWVNTLLVFISC